MIVVIPTRPRSSSHLSYTDYLVQELIPFVDTHFRTIADRNGRGIGGWPLGGADALMATLARPDVFSSAAGLAVGGVASQQILDLALDHKQYLHPVAFWMHWGTSDEAVGRPSGILDILGRLSIPHAYLETGGDHTGSLRAYTDSALAFLADHMDALPPIRVTEATERFAVVAGAVPEALTVALRLGTSTPPGRSVRVDTEDLGGAPLRLDDDGDGRYTGRLVLPQDLPRGLYRFPLSASAPMGLRSISTPSGSPSTRAPTRRCSTGQRRDGPCVRARHLRRPRAPTRAARPWPCVPAGAGP